MTNLVQRCITGLVLGMAIVGLVYAGPYGFLMLLVVINFLGLWEFYRLFSRYAGYPRKFVATLLSISLLATSYMVFMNQYNLRKALKN